MRWLEVVFVEVFGSSKEYSFQVAFAWALGAFRGHRV